MPEIRDIKPPLDWPANYAWLIVLLILMIGMGIVFLWWRIKKQNEDKRNVLPQKTIWEVIFEELAKLEKEDLLSKGNFKEYYFKLSDILRCYIEERFNIRAPEMTTEEFLFSLEKVLVFQDSQKGILREFLRFCDLVKFAKHVPFQEEAVKALVIVKNFIEETK